MNRKGSFRSKHSHCTQVKSMLCDAIKVLCGNTISYNNCLSIEALIGVTVDNSEVILINVQEILEKSQGAGGDVSQDLEEAEMESGSSLLMVSSDGIMKADPNERFFDILSDEVIQVEDEEKKELDDLQATICIKEEDNLDCLMNNGNYESEVFPSVSQIQTDNGFLMTNQFYPTDSTAVGDNYSQVQDSRSFVCDQKWPTYTTDAMHGRQFLHRAGRSGTYNCRLCKKVFGSQAIYLRHKKKYHQPVAKMMPVPTFGDSSADQMNGNLENMSDENWMMASSLGKKSAVLSEEVTNVTLYTCSICGKTIRHQSSFLRHKRQHEGIVYKCDLCGAVISRRDALQVHKRKCAVRLQQIS